MKPSRLLFVGKWLVVISAAVLVPMLLSSCASRRPVLAESGKAFALRLQLKQPVEEQAHIKLVAFTQGTAAVGTVTFFGKTFAKDQDRKVVFSNERIILDPKAETFDFTATPSSAIAGQAFIIAAYEVENATDEPGPLTSVLGFAVIVVDDAPGATPPPVDEVQPPAPPTPQPAFQVRGGGRPGKVKTPIGIAPH